MAKAISNRSAKRMKLKAQYCKATGDYKQAIQLLSTLIEDESKKIGLVSKKLVSHSYIQVPSRAKCTDSSKLTHYNKGDYYFNKASFCTFDRAQKQVKKTSKKNTSTEKREGAV